ncbi:hypothetical protein O2W14_03815 [Modestobacter sp. VKM Ac-2986]|uniref:hypothetical protein n=1 Tax=Modestobacter sp. VKM Ac-2986 TaxID=3004140 RepID=UPI0022AA8F1D|nr:hypothetical protein [Modestobacter sp. VKM Ac-2986]MCZ2827962.1 hypothetical protein [Modestobacter sp. VKM Ac-2986]
MAIEVLPAQLYALATVLDGASVRAARAGTAVDPAPVGGPLGPAVLGFAETVRTVGGALAGELSWLGDVVAATADSWMHLDGSLLPARGAGVPE